jgi:hypothetical protein
VAESQIVIELWRGNVPRVERQARDTGFSVPDEPPVVRRSREHAVRTFPAGNVQVGSHPSCDVRISDIHVSRRALVIRYRDGTHIAELRNRNGVEHRLWGQAPQPITGDGSAPMQVALGRGNHAFIMFGGAQREVAYFVLVQVGPTPGRRGRRAAVDDTPEHWPSQMPRPNERNVERFREIYWRYLVWPPMLHPEPVMDNEFVVNPAHAHADMIKLAARLGYVPPTRATSRQPMLPRWLIERGVLEFARHAQWRGTEGELMPYLAPDEREARRVGKG